jgi:hypothetical protein
VNPAHSLAQGKDWGEAGVAARGQNVFDLIVQRKESAYGSGKQQHMGAPRAVPADADVEVLGIETRGLQHLHLDDRDVLAVAGAPAQRLAGVGPEIGDAHIVEVVRPVNLLVDQPLDHPELCNRIEAGSPRRQPLHQRIPRIGRCHPPESSIVEGHARIQRHRAEHVGALGTRQDEGMGSALDGGRGTLNDQRMLCDRNGRADR